jgi:SPP1 gp7 family putative phage head morphogenesis protein
MDRSWEYPVSAPNSTYWTRRAEEAQALYDADIDLAELQMQSVLSQTKKDAELAVRRHADRFGLNYSENQKPVTAQELVEFRQEFNELSRGTSGYPTELNVLSMRIQMSRQEMLAQQMGVFAAQISDGQLRVATSTIDSTGQTSQSFSQFSVETGFNMSVDWDSASPNQLRALMQSQRGENFYSDRLWANREKLVNTLNTEIAQGMILGRSTQEMADRIAGAMGSSTSAAMRIVRTETTAISTTAEIETYRQLGMKEYEYLSTLDSRTSSVCRDMDGSTIKLEDINIGVNAPPLHPNCRSTIIPVVEDDEFSIPAERAARDEDGKTVYVPADMTYEDWKRAKEDGTLGERSQDPWRSSSQPLPPTPTAPTRSVEPKLEDFDGDFVRYVQEYQRWLDTHSPKKDLNDPLIKISEEFIDKSHFDFRDIDRFAIDHMTVEEDIPKLGDVADDRWLNIRSDSSALFEDLFSVDRMSSIFRDSSVGPVIAVSDHDNSDSSKVSVRVGVESGQTIDRYDPRITDYIEKMKSQGVSMMSESVVARQLGFDFITDGQQTYIVNPRVLTLDREVTTTIGGRRSHKTISEDERGLIMEIGSLRARMMDDESNQVSSRSEPTTDQLKAIIAYTESGNTIPSEVADDLDEYLSGVSSNSVVLRRAQDVSETLQVGDSLRTEGFISTSSALDEGVTVSVGGQDPAIIYIKVPEGTPATAIYPFQNPGLRFAGEVLINRGYEMVVESVYARSDGKKVVVAGLRGQDHGSSVVD